MIEFRKEIHNFFIDFKSAYDTVDWKAFRMLLLVKLVKEILTKVENKNTESGKQTFPKTNGKKKKSKARNEI